MRVEIEAWLADLVPRFLANRMQDLEMLEQALAAGDAPSLSAVAHRIRGGAASYGFADMAAAAERLEVAAGAAGVDELRRLVDEIGENVRGVTIVYR